ncbi:MAG: hypothetical protein ISS25_01665 [Nanoarchaeota archaeon]|nr:hypothetical protein [DPANN group archaeon]MBL7116517.1 hypothetical protein [Nanoarchaeota archaeon]
MRRKLIILPILLVLTAYSVLAANFYVSSEPIKKDIFISEVAQFNVTIANMLGIPDVYTLSTQDPLWNLLTNQVQVPANSVKSFILEIYPGANIDIKPHAFTVKIKSSMTGDFSQELFLVNVRPYDPVFGEYRPSIQFGVTIDKEIDPRKKVPVEVYTRNRNALDIGELIIAVDGTLFSDEIKTTLGPLEEKRTEYLFEIDPLQEPGLYSLDVKIKVKNVTISRSTQNYEVIAYSTITMDSVEKTFLFKTTETITLENLGNTEKIKKVNLVMPWTKRIFTNSEPDYKTARADGETSLQWEITIKPQEFTEITVTTNYRIPIFIIILIIVIIVLYYVLRSPVVITKEALISGSREEGVEHLKIRLFVKNRSRKTVENVTVFDRVPGIAEFVKKKVLGTLYPEKITKQEKKGTLIKWNLENLEPFEERIITYEIKSKLKIIGNISLPTASVRFIDNNKEKRMYSQRVVVTN